MTERVVRRRVHRWPGGAAEDDTLAAEEPLEIRVEGESLAVTLRTPGDDLDLAAGFLYTEAVIDGPDDLAALAHVRNPADPRDNTVDARLAAGVEAHRAALDRAKRELYATSSCGICGKASIDRVHLGAPPLDRVAEVDPALLRQLPARLAEAQAAFAQTGGLHAAGLFDLQGNLEVIREDIGRHNAVDKALGHRLREGRLPVDDRILVVSSRAGFEIVQKALVARVPLVAALGAASSLAVDLARESRMALVGFLRKDRFNRYA